MIKNGGMLFAHDRYASTLAFSAISLFSLMVTHNSADSGESWSQLLPVLRLIPEDCISSSIVKKSTGQNRSILA
jgi:hypothetical protein